MNLNYTKYDDFFKRMEWKGKSLFDAGQVLGNWLTG